MGETTKPCLYHRSRNQKHVSQVHREISYTGAGVQLVVVSCVCKELRLDSIYFIIKSGHKTALMEGRNTFEAITDKT